MRLPNLAALFILPQAKPPVSLLRLIDYKKQRLWCCRG